MTGKYPIQKSVHTQEYWAKFSELMLPSPIKFLSLMTSICLVIKMKVEIIVIKRTLK